MDLTAAADYFWQAQPGSFWKAPRSAQDDTVRATYGIKLRTKQSMPCGVGTHFSVSTLIRQAFGRASLEELPSRVQGARVARPDQDPWWSTHVAPRWAVAGQTDSSRSFSWQACGYSEDVALNSCHSTECRATRSLSINAAQASKHKRDAHSIPGSSKWFRFSTGFGWVTFWVTSAA